MRSSGPSAFKGQVAATLLFVLHSLLHLAVGLLDMIGECWREPESTADLSMPQHTMPLVRPAAAPVQATAAGETAAEQMVLERAGEKRRHMVPTAMEIDSQEEQSQEPAAAATAGGSAGTSLPVGQRKGTAALAASLGRAWLVASYTPVLRLRSYCVELPGMQPKDMHSSCLERLRAAVEEQPWRYLLGVTLRGVGAHSCSATVDTAELLDTSAWDPSPAASAILLRPTQPASGAAALLDAVRRGVAAVARRCDSSGNAAAAAAGQRRHALAAVLAALPARALGWVARCVLALMRALAPQRRARPAVLVRREAERERDKAAGLPPPPPGVPLESLRRVLMRRPWYDYANWAWWALLWARRAEGALLQRFGLRLERAGRGTGLAVASQQPAGGRGASGGDASGGGASCYGGGGGVTVRSVTVSPRVLLLQSAPGLAVGAEPQAARFSVCVSACCEGGERADGGGGGCGAEDSGGGGPAGLHQGPEALPPGLASLRIHMRRGSQHVSMYDPGAASGTGPCESAPSSACAITVGKPCRRRACCRHLTLACNAAVACGGSSSEQGGLAPGLLFVDLDSGPSRGPGGELTAPKPALVLAVDDPRVAEELQRLAAAVASEPMCETVLADLAVFVQQATELRTAAAAALDLVFGCDGAGGTVRGHQLRSVWTLPCTCAQEGRGPCSRGRQQPGPSGTAPPQQPDPATIQRTAGPADTHAATPSTTAPLGEAAHHGAGRAAPDARGAHAVPAAAAAAASAVPDVCAACALHRVQHAMYWLLPVGELVQMGEGLLKLGTSLALHRSAAYVAGFLTDLRRIELLEDLMSGRAGVGGGGGSAAAGAAAPDPTGVSGRSSGRRGRDGGDDDSDGNGVDDAAWSEDGVGWNGASGAAAAAAAGTTSARRRRLRQYMPGARAAAAAAFRQAEQSGGGWAAWLRGLLRAGARPSLARQSFFAVLALVANVVLCQAAWLLLRALLSVATKRIGLSVMWQPSGV